MPEGDSRLKRSIGLSGVILWVLAVAAVIAVGTAAAERRYGMVIGGSVFLVAAAALGVRAARARRQ